MLRMHPRIRLSLCAALVTTSVLAGCNPPPRESFQQWVARDAWDPGCAEQAMIERWSVRDARWKIEGQTYAIDVDATFKLANACTSGLTLDGINVQELLERGGGAIRRSYKQFENVEFKKTVELSKCDKNGAAGWSLPGKESTRCWTGPSLVDTAAPGR
jgi:hypothetical protein